MAAASTKNYGAQQICFSRRNVNTYKCYLARNMSLVFGCLLFLFVALYVAIIRWNKTKVKLNKKNCLRHIDEDAEF